ncbi:MAG: prenyltransferase/squalene oxidase repeat-containing protein [Planctomycetota bacterium]
MKTWLLCGVLFVVADAAALEPACLQEGDPEMSADTERSGGGFGPSISSYRQAIKKFPTHPFFPKDRDRRAGHPSVRAQRGAVEDALLWLVDHQDAQGFWDADEFYHSDRFKDQPSSMGPGNPVMDVAMTSLVALALQGNGNSLGRGRHKEALSNSVAWLRDTQQVDGLFGFDVGNPTLTTQALATMAMGESYYMSSQTPVLKRPMQRAVQILEQAQVPSSGWGYYLDGTGPCNTKTTGWIILALHQAEVNDLAVDPKTKTGAQDWFLSATEAETHRVGFEWSNKSLVLYGIPEACFGPNAPPGFSEASTAIALLSTMLMTPTDGIRTWSEHPDYPKMQAQVQILMGALPHWQTRPTTIDLEYWYFATEALYQWGGPEWETWNRAIQEALLPHQRLENRKDNFYGSWDPVGVWGQEGGRIHSTALCALILQTPSRRAKLLAKPPLEEADKSRIPESDDQG